MCNDSLSRVIDFHLMELEKKRKGKALEFIRGNAPQLLSHGSNIKCDFNLS